MASLTRKMRMRAIPVSCMAILGIVALVACVARGPAQPPLAAVEDAHQASAKRVAFSPCGGYLASAGYQGEIKIWTVPDLSHRLTFSQHRDTPWGIAWLDGRIVISGDDDGRIIVWDSHDGRIIRSAETSSAVTSLALIPNRGLAVFGHGDGRVRSFDALSLKPLGEYDAGAKILSVAVGRRQEVVAVSCSGRRVFMLNNDLQILYELPAPPLNALELAVSPSGGQLAGGGWFRLFLWNLPAKTLKVISSDHWGQVYSLDYTPDGHYLATIGRQTDSEIYLVDARTGRFNRHLKRHALCGTVVRISPDGHYLASGSDDASIRLYDLSAPIGLHAR